MSAQESGEGKVHDLVILGGGPAGMAAGIYAGRGGLDAVLLDMMGGGGQMNMIDRIENYPGVVGLDTGAALADIMRQQTESFGMSISFDQATGLRQEDDHLVVEGGDQRYPTQRVLVATGARHRPLGVPGEGKLMGRGVSVCATCDGNFFRGKPVAVIGGGDSAIMEALYLTRVVGQVTVIHRRDELRAEKYLQDKLRAADNVDFVWDTVVEEILGETEVTGLRLKNVKTGATSERAVEAVFVFIGLVPNTDFLKGLVDLDSFGFIPTDTRMRTSHPAIYAAGDVRAESVRQIGAAVGEGITAAVTIQEELDTQTPTRQHLSRPETEG